MKLSLPEDERRNRRAAPSLRSQSIKENMHDQVPARTRRRRRRADGNDHRRAGDSQALFQPDNLLEVSPRALRRVETADPRPGAARRAISGRLPLRPELQLYNVQ